MKAFGKNLKLLRKERRLSQSDLAHDLGVTQTAISYWESGLSEPPLDVIRKITKILKVTYEDLLND